MEGMLPRDFKSLASTNFAIRAMKWHKRIGGGGRNRTGVDGFAGRCITTLLPRRGLSGLFKLKGENALGCAFPENLERERSLELPTSTLARLRSTN